ncbi:MAG: permease-like cell division protein FtsX [Proteobacteria bacterium]|nr:permease-like cell division protein FtsX [Pseudomonadota bacterium]
MTLLEWAAHVGRAGRNVFRGGWPSLLATTVIAVALLVFGLVSVVLSNLQNVLEGGAVYSLHVFLRDDATSLQKQRIKDELAKLPGAEGVTRVSKDQAWHKFKRLFDDRPGMAAGLSPRKHPLPESFVVRFAKPWSSDRRLDKLTRRLTALPGVEEVATGRPWARRWIAVLRAVKPVGFGLTVLLLASVTLIVAGTVRLNLHRRRMEMNVMSLVGASRSFIRTPVLIEGALQGALGAALAVSGLYLIHVLVRTTLSPALYFGLGNWLFLSPVNVATMGLAGLGAGLVGGLLAVAGWRET